MSWWKKLWRSRARSLDGPSPEGLALVSLNMPGSSEEASGRGDLRVWRDSEQNVLSLAVLPFLVLPEISNETARQSYARDLAESRNGGFIEVRKFK